MPSSFGDPFSHGTGRWVKKERRIDRASDRYVERVTDPVTGEIVHDEDERRRAAVQSVDLPRKSFPIRFLIAMSDHQGHGTEHVARLPGLQDARQAHGARRRIHGGSCRPSTLLDQEASGCQPMITSSRRSRFASTLALRLNRGVVHRSTPRRLPANRWSNGRVALASGPVLISGESLFSWIDQGV